MRLSGRDIDSIKSKFNLIKQRGAEQNLIINERDCELITKDGIDLGVISVTCENAILLGAPVSSESSVTAVLTSKLQELERLEKNCTYLTPGCVLSDEELF